MTASETKELLIEVTKRAYAEKLFAATSGNLSIYDREAQRMYITPSGYPYDLMTVDDVMVIDLDGNILDGPHKPSSEWRMHAAIYRAYPDTNAVVHTHSPYATAFAINHMPIAAVLFEIAYFLGGDVPVAEAALPGTPAVGENAVKALKDRHACLMANHGALAVADNLKLAYDRAVYLEDAAKAYSLALGHGPVFTLDPRDVEKFRN